MGAKKQTIGFHYLFDILFGLSRGPLNDLRAIRVADKIAWDGPLCSGDVQAIRKPDLFGGKKKEGGIQGPFRVFWGDADQVLPGAGSANCGSTGPVKGVQTLKDVKDQVSDGDAEKRSLISEFRGTTMLWFSGLVSSMNPYPKEWSFRVRRYSAGWFNDQCWYAAKSVIFMADGKVHAMNPAHIIYECYTNPEWGLGYPTDRMDANSFTYSADLFCSEGFGLCLAWQRKEDVDQFIDIVKDYVAAVTYEDPETGLITLKPVRADYVVEDLPLFTPSSGLLAITDDDATSSDDIFNEMIGTGHDPLTDEDFQVRVHNIAARMSQGAPNSLDKDYKGVPTKELLGRILQRELKVHASGLKSYKVVLDRTGYQLRPGMCFRVQDLRRGINTVVLRVGKIEDQSFKDGRITVSAIQDVYSMPATSFVAVVDSTWTPPPTDALPAAAETLVEANYRDLVLREDSSVLASMSATDAFVGALAASPNSAMYEYTLASRAAGETEFDTDKTGAFTGTALLVDDITPLQTVFSVTGESSFTAANVGEAILVDDEQMELVAFDEATHQATVARGVADTIPAEHLAGARLWTIDDDLVGDRRAYVSGETVEGKILTHTSSDILDEADAALLTVTVDGRQARPYPPGNVMVDGTLALTPLPNNANGHAEPVIAWAHRDRVVQEDQLVSHTDASVGPEAGTTYTIRLYEHSTPGVLLREVTGIAADNWTYDAATQAADGDPVAVFVELEAERDTLTSHQHYRFLVWLQSGYGLGYGLNYGGF